jgi:hypothetical protein
LANVCFICREPVELDQVPGFSQSGSAAPQLTKYMVTCKRCGNYKIDYFLVTSPPRLGEDTPLVSAATRQASERDRPLELDGSTDFDQLADAHRFSTVSQKVQMLLRAIAEKCERPGNPTRIIKRFDYPLADCQDSNELDMYLGYLSDKGLIAFAGGPGDEPSYWPTIDGWQTLEPTLRPGGEAGRCFVAMWFDDSMDSVYNEGIAKGITDAGCKPYRVKEDPINKGVSDHILAEIRRSQFVVADFTEQRSSVYFEAGFAHGIGREVVWCCRQDQISSLTFDTKHLGHIAWKDPADLRSKLEISIRANIIPRR